MSLLRRRMMMQTAKSGAKYPLVNGRHKLDNGGYVEVSNGNHVHVVSGRQNTYINCSNIEQNTETDFSNIPAWFTIPAGAACALRLSNINRYGRQTSAYVNFMKANSTSESDFRTENLADSVDAVTEASFENSEPISFLFFRPWNYTPEIEFDVTLTVNGERWI